MCKAWCFVVAFCEAVLLCFMIVVCGVWCVSSRRRDCHSAAPPSTFGRCFNVDGEGMTVKMTVSPTAMILCVRVRSGRRTGRCQNCGTRTRTAPQRPRSRSQRSARHVRHGLTTAAFVALFWPQPQRLSRSVCATAAACVLPRVLPTCGKCACERSKSCSRLTKSK